MRISPLATAASYCPGTPLVLMSRNLAIGKLYNTRQKHAANDPQAATKTTWMQPVQRDAPVPAQRPAVRANGSKSVVHLRDRTGPGRSVSGRPSGTRGFGLAGVLRNLHRQPAVAERATGSEQIADHDCGGDLGLVRPRLIGCLDMHIDAVWALCRCGNRHRDELFCPPIQ